MTTARREWTDEMNDVGGQLARICEAAAEVILPLWRSTLAVDRKADDSPVTEADRRAENLILAMLEAAFPGVPVVSEEDAAEFGTPEEIGPRFFLVDPLDGTKAFVRGDPNFTVNIGLVDNGVAIAGAVNAPPTGETWFTQGGSAMKRTGGGEACAISARPWPEGEAVALVSHTMKEDELRRLVETYGFRHPKAMDSSIKLCRIAEGAADLYPRHGPTMEWDIAAGHAVLSAAGGRLTGLDQQPFVYGKAAKGFRNPGFVARGAG